MFFVLNKEKICTYILSLTVVIGLLGSANYYIKNNAVETNAKNQKILPIYSVKREDNKIAFTMNCAWNDDDIDEILKVLKENNTYITFFVVGDWAEKYKESLKKIYDAGHEIGCHSNTHPHVNKLSYEDNAKQINDGVEKIKEITGEATKLYRTPYGEYNNTVINAAEKNGYYTIQWNLDTLDYKGLTGEEMWKRLNGKIQKGSIILSHNGTKYTASSLDMIIKNIKKEGFDIVKVSDLIYKENYNINNQGIQISK